VQAASNMTIISYDLIIPDINVQFLYTYISRKLKEPSSQINMHGKEIPICTPRKEIARRQSNFPHSCVCELSICDGPSIFLQLQKNRQNDRGNINRSQKHECSNGECGRAIPFLVIFVSNFRYVSLQCGLKVVLMVTLR
jgi:hypothetical protein